MCCPALCEQWITVAPRLTGRVWLNKSRQNTKWASYCCWSGWCGAVSLSFRLTLACLLYFKAAVGNFFKNMLAYLLKLFPCPDSVIWASFSVFSLWFYCHLQKYTNCQTQPIGANQACVLAIQTLLLRRVCCGWQINSFTVTLGSFFSVSSCSTSVILRLYALWVEKLWVGTYTNPFSLPTHHILMLVQVPQHHMLTRRVPPSCQ